ncbi:NACHT domain-containing NTPase [Nocardia sp. NRRL S-836]|uniref:NACHT domain-containing protein n=1 Tax=Nocardia sp. NRRL S-836 TaxID=1519492 RepID=UPI0006AF78CF|nr:AAA family ATPase [Nocardia sp. NRRL S-836]
MRRTYSYAEAVKVLGGKDHPVVAALDKVLGGALLAGSLGLWQVLDLFDAKPDFTRLFSELVTKLSEGRRKLGRYDRTQRLAAAHAVVVMTAFFESLQALELPFRLSSADMGHVNSFAPFEQSLPLPKAGRPYEENLRQIAVDFPEIAFWCSIEDHRGTRAALARLEEVLRETTTDITADVRQTELSAIYRAALNRPLFKSADVPAGLHVPTLGEAYVDPRFQVLTSSSHPHVPSIAESWADLPEYADLDIYLVGHLTSPRACNAPLLVLGDPGSGKSVLTEVLAARLPASDFAVVRIELRDTPVDADLVGQVEHGLHRLLDERVSWAEFSRCTGGAVPVVVLDGLDELMQATGVSQTRYLTTVAELQERLQAKGRPAIFVVTSRLSVCAGMELPPWSSVVRLLPFSDEQVRQWLDVWNAANPPLPAEVALSYPDLAEQPLLLLMLALFEAVDGSLRRDHGSLGRGQLYERLLTRFAEREVTKLGAARSAADLRVDVEFELDRLSVVALAMFNRGVQWVTEQQVSADLAVLLEVESADRSVGTRTPLSAGELALGRFLFVQKAEAVRSDDTRLAT